MTKEETRIQEELELAHNIKEKRTAAYILALLNANEALRTALEFYSSDCGSHTEKRDWQTRVLEDEGEVANDALAEHEGVEAPEV